MKILVSKGNRLFTFVWLLFVVSAVGHGSSQWPDDEHLNTLADSMNDYVFENPTGLEPSLLDIFWGVWLEVALFMLGVAALNLVALIAAEGSPRVKRSLLIADLCFMVPLTVLFVVYPVPPPLFVFGLTSVLCALDLALTRVPE